MVSIGRSPGHTVVIDDPFVSRHHGEITLLEKGYQYRDLNSTHGTILTRRGEENYVRQVVLRGDDLLRDCKAQTRSPGSGLGLGRLYELIEDRFEFALRNPRAPVRD